MATNYSQRANVRGVVLAVSLLCIAPVLAGNASYANAQAHSGFQKTPIAPLRAIGLDFKMRLKQEIGSKATSGRRQTRVIIGTIAGATAGWLLGRAYGDNFNTPGMILLGAFGAIMGLAFSPRE